MRDVANVMGFKYPNMFQQTGLQTSKFEFILD
jgi:hypothetical protein